MTATGIVCERHTEGRTPADAGTVITASEINVVPLASYIDFYHRWRVHQPLEMDAPDHRRVHPPELGDVVEFPDVGGLQRHYERCAAKPIPSAPRTAPIRSLRNRGPVTARRATARTPRGASSSPDLLYCP